MLGNYTAEGSAATTGPLVQFGILGTLAVRVGDVPVDAGPPRQRALTALLVVHAGEVLSNDRILDDLWGASPPPTARHAVQVYVSGLRSGLVAAGARGGVVATRAPGYALCVADEAIDARRAERYADEGADLLDDGDAAAARAALADALALWRGDPLCEFRYEGFAEAEIRRLEELRLRILELAVSADLLLGRHREVIADLESLTVQHPTQERLWAHLVTALHLSGRRAEALAAYARAATALDDELGVEPSPALQRLRASIVRDHGEDVAESDARGVAPSGGGSWSRW